MKCYFFNAENTIDVGTHIFVGIASSFIPNQSRQSLHFVCQCAIKNLTLHYVRKNSICNVMCKMLMKSNAEPEGHHVGNIGITLAKKQQHSTPLIRTILDLITSLN